MLNRKAPTGGNRTGAEKVINTSKNIASLHKDQALSFALINTLALSALPALLHRWLPDGIQRGHEYKARNPRRDDHKAGSFSINIRTGCWADFATGDKGGDVVSLAAYLFGISQGEALRSVAGMLGVHHG